MTVSPEQAETGELGPHASFSSRPSFSAIVSGSRLDESREAALSFITRDFEGAQPPTRHTCKAYLGHPLPEQGPDAASLSQNRQKNGRFSNLKLHKAVCAGYMLSSNRSNNESLPLPDCLPESQLLRFSGDPRATTRIISCVALSVSDSTFKVAAMDLADFSDVEFLIHRLVVLCYGIADCFPKLKPAVGLRCSN